MALSIRNRKAERAARQLSAATGESLTEAILHALEDRLARLRARTTEADLVDQIMDIGQRCAALPDIDTRTAEEILGYRRDGTVS